MLWLGDRSYAIYLLNLAVITFTIVDLGIMAGPLSPLARAGVELAMVAGIVVLSDLSYRYLEKPARRAIRSAWARRSGAGATVAAAG
jgi:peptidoglycan/LPS O-acetylase OafA/YrhL